MVKEQGYVSIRRVLDDLTEHPLMRGLTVDQVVRYAVRFIQVVGHVKLYEDKAEKVEIRDWRGVLPCDLVSIVGVRDTESGIYLRAMTDVMPKGLVGEVKSDWPDEREEPAFKTQGRVIYTSMREGCVEVAYKAIRTDDDGFPMIMDNENYIDALEAYVKKEVFTMKFDTGKINLNVLQNAQQDYAWKVRRLGSELTTPSVAEMETITNLINTNLLSRRHFQQGFRHLGDRECIRRH